MKYDILVNKENSLDSEYIPHNLVNTNTRANMHLKKNHKVLLVDIVFKMFNKMKKDALKYGYDIDVDSGYRSYEYQKQILDKFIESVGEERAKETIAEPGKSEHQTGLAVDFCLFINGSYIDDITDEQEETKWIHKNCYKYGFILRYPKGKEDITGYSYEPWHLRFVGKRLAKYIYNNNITLEEFWKKTTNVA
jgi:D-alanyl-D-alanine carboxypeptidase